MSDVDLFHDRLLRGDARREFAARMEADPTVRDDLEFRRNLDDRLRMAFRMPTDNVGEIGESGARSRFGLGPWIALAAAVLLAFSFAWSQRDPGVDAMQLWQELTPAFGCNVGVVTEDAFAQSCLERHGVALRMKIPKGANVHGPTRVPSLPNATVWTVMLPPVVPFGPAEMRIVLVGVPRPIRGADGVHFFERDAGGLRIVEITTYTDSRVLPWLTGP